MKVDEAEMDVGLDCSVGVFFPGFVMILIEYNAFFRSYLTRRLLRAIPRGVIIFSRRVRRLKVQLHKTLQ